MAASPSCKASLGAAFGTAALLHHRVLPSKPDSCILHVLPPKSFNRAGNDAITTENTDQICRLASFAVAATAWAGLSLCPPSEALALVYGTANPQKMGELVTSTFTGYPDREDDELHIDYLPEMATPAGNVPSIKPPNEGLNSPWIPKMNGLKKNSTESKKRVVKCPPWTLSELEMVLPDLQGKPKPFPRTQGQVYPFWAATMMDGDNGGGRNEQVINQLGDQEDFVLAIDAFSTPLDAAQDTQDRETLPSAAPATAPPPPITQSPTKKPSTCFTM